MSRSRNRWLLDGATGTELERRGYGTELPVWTGLVAREKPEILRAVHAELSGGPKTGLAPYERSKVLCFRQRDLAIVGRR